MKTNTCEDKYITYDGVLVIVSGIVLATYGTEGDKLTLKITYLNSTSITLYFDDEENRSKVFSSMRVELNAKFLILKYQ